MHRGRSGQDVSCLSPRSATGPIGDAAADLDHQGGAGYDVPGVEAQLEKSVKCARRGPREIQRGRARAPQVFETRKRAFHHRQIAGQQLLVSKWKPSRDDCIRWVNRAQRWQALAVEGRALAPRRCKLLVEKRRDDDAEQWQAAIQEAD